MTSRNICCPAALATVNIKINQQIEQTKCNPSPSKPISKLKMKSMPRFLYTARQGGLFFRVCTRTLALLIFVAMLAACISTPFPIGLPGATGSCTLPAASPTPSPSAALPPLLPPIEPATPALPETSQSTKAQATPVAPAPPLITLPAAPSPFYSAAVSARVPAPSVVYSTPGLQVDRTTFSTQAEIQAWLRQQVASASRASSGVKAAVVPIGKSQRGQTLEALVLTRSTSTDPAALHTDGRPTVLLIGQQHGDDPAGSEALLVIARELAQGLLQPVLNNINVVIVPRANPDAADTGLREVPGQLDIYRDHLLINTPEAQALAGLTRDYRPTVVVYSHEYMVAGRFLEKFGTLQKFDALFQYATTANLPEFLTKAAEEWFRRPILSAFKSQGLSNEWYYTTSTNLADKKISMGDALAETGRNVNGLKNIVSLLIETRGAGIGRQHIQRRVHTHVTAITSVLASTSQRATELSQLRPYIDKEVTTQACKGDAVVEAELTPAQYDLQLLDPVSGADKAITVDWLSALALRTVRARVRPCGYWLSTGSTTAIERLRLHGVKVMLVAEPGTMLGDIYKETSRIEDVREAGQESTAGSSKVIRAKVRLVRGVLDIPRGSYYIPLNQPLGNLVLAALEPDTQSSYFSNQILLNLESTMRVMAPPLVKFEELP